MSKLRRSARKLLLAAIIVFAAAPPVFPETDVPGTAAQNFHQWGSITVFNGLPSDTVRGITQTDDGLIWFATDNGLASFDGRTIRRVDLGSTESNHVQALASYRGNDIWIATRKGAFFYRDGNVTAIAGTESLTITAMSAPREGFLVSDLEGIHSDVLSVDIAGDGVPVKAAPFAANAGRAELTSLASMALGEVLVGSKGDGVLQPVGGRRLGQIRAAGSPLFINSLAAGDGSLWIGADASKGQSGVYRVTNGGKAVRLNAATAKVLAVHFDKGTIWAGSERYGLFCFDAEGGSTNFTFENTSGGLRSDTVFSIFTDREGVLWVGTNRGVSRFDQNGVVQRQVSDLPNRNFVRTFWQSGDGRVTYAGTNRGLLSLDGNEWSTVPGTNDAVVYSIGSTVDGLAYGTPQGAYDLKGKQLATGDVRAIEMFNGRTYAAIVGIGVVDISSPDQKVILAEGTANSLLLGGSGKLWIGTANGIFSFDGGTVRSEVGPDILRSGTIWKMFMASPQTLWIAGQHGVFKLEDGRVEPVIEAEDVRDVFVDERFVWAATTSKGLIHARRDDRFGWLVSPIGFEQGLPSDKAFAILPVADGLMVATNRGIVNYDPREVPPRLVAVRVLSQRFHDLSELRSTLALDYPQNGLLVEVAGLSSRTFAEEFQYGFVLKKGDDVIDQRVSNDPKYAPSDLKPGEYSIEAVAFDRDLNPSDPLVIRFSIAKAPFPLTSAALAALLVLAVAGLAWAFFEHRRIRQRNRELAAARLDLANEAERERRRIARDLHDQTLADLRNLMMTSDEILPGNKRFRDEVEAVSGEIRRICEDLSPSVLENVGLTASLEFLLGKTIAESKFTADPGIEDRIEFPMSVQLQIYRIAQEILTNIKRHSTAQRVEMGIRVDDKDQFALEITDDGKPFEPERKGNNGRGIANVRGRASMIGADVVWRSASDGNTFTLTLDGRAD